MTNNHLKSTKIKALSNNKSIVILFNQVRDGEECGNDGCKPRYRSEPTYDAFCHYTVNKWAHQGWTTAQGTIHI